MSNLEQLSPSRQAAIREAAAGCWEGTEELIGALVRESRHKGAWKPVRAALLTATAPTSEVHMTAAQFGIWKKQARALVKITGRTERPVDDLGMKEQRFSELSNAKRQLQKKISISRSEALGCAHYLTGLPKPCTPEELADWFWPRFGAFAHIAPLFDMKAQSFAARINGYVITDGVRETVVPEGHFIRALDWIWRFGPVSPYGERPAVALWPEQEALPR